MSQTGASPPTGERDRDSDIVTVGSGPPSANDSAEVGPGRLFGRYMVLELLGCGGMGAVYAAYDPQLDRRVALKVLKSRTDALRNPRSTQRLLREAQAMARLAHPNVIAVHDVGTFDDEVFLAMEYVAGTTLGGWLREQPRSWEQIRDTFVAAGAGLAAAHSAGLVHRDFKPDNVLVDSEGRARVTDFGLARADDTSLEGPVSASGDPAISEGTPLSLRITRAGARIGTPGYMAPEQHAGDPADALSDQFAFCVALYEAFFERPPFRGATVAELSANVVAGKVRQPPRDSPVPGPIRRAVLRGLSRRPAHRFASMAALLHELAFDPRLLRRRLLLGAGAVALAAAAAAAGAHSSDAPVVASCTGAGEEIVRNFGDARQTAVAAAYESTRHVAASEVWLLAQARLGTYAERYGAVAQEVCEAGRTHAREPTVLARQQTCLSGIVAQFDAQIDVFAQADADVVDNTAHAVGRLPRPEDCADLDQIEEMRALPDDPELRLSIDAANVKLAQLTALSRAGRHGRTVELGLPLLVEVEGLQWAPLTVDVLMAVAASQGESTDSAAALETYQRAISVAARSGDDARLLNAWIRYLAQLVHEPGRQHDALVLCEFVETLAIRAGDTPESRLKIANLKGTAFLFLGRLDEARASLAAVMDDANAVEGKTSESVRANFALVLLGLGECDRARTVLEGNLEASRALHRTDHRTIVELLANIAITYRYQQRDEEALLHVDEALAMAQRLGTGPLRVEATLRALRAQVAQARGQWDVAEAELSTADLVARAFENERGAITAMLESGRAILDVERGNVAEGERVLHDLRGWYARQMGAGALQTVLQGVELGKAAEARGDAPAAIPLYEQAIAGIDAAVGLDHVAHIEPLARLGRSLVDAGRPQEATIPLRRAIAISETAGLEVGAFARPHFDLARATIDSDPAAAIELARRATSDIRRSQYRDTRLLAVVEAWLREHTP